MSDVPEGFMSGAEFARHVEPLIEILRAHIDAARADRPDDGAPDPASPAMRELASQRMFPSDTEGVVDVALTMSNQQVHVGEDHMLAVCSLLGVESETFVWSYPVLGRAALEAFAGAAHLAKLGIPDQLRAGRVMNELIATGKALDKLPPQIQRLENRAAYRQGQAAAMGLTRITDKKGKNTPWFEEHRPGYTDLVVDLFDPDGLGATIYNAWSAVAHSSSWGLSQSLGDAQAHPFGSGVRAPVVLTLQGVTSIAVALILGHRGALERLAAWTGWRFPLYDETYRKHSATVSAFLGNTQAGDTAEEPAPIRLADLLWTPGAG